MRRSGESGQRIASYRVHFQGWKASWDREVTEEMLLDDTPFNRELMFRIDEITRRTRRIEEVRDRIDRVLSHIGRIRSSGKLAEGEAFDWSQVDGILPPPPQQDGRGRLRGAGRKVSASSFCLGFAAWKGRPMIVFFADCSCKSLQCVAQASSQWMRIEVLRMLRNVL